MSYAGYAGFGVDPSPESGTPASSLLPDDVAPSAIQQLVSPVYRQRGWVAVPSQDMRQYIQTQVIIVAVGFGFGLTVGALFGDILRGRHLGATRVLNNNAGKRRTSARKRKRGRPTVKPVISYEDWVKMPDGYHFVTVDRGLVRAGVAHRSPGQARQGDVVGTVYDAGTTFRSVPGNWDAPVQEFTTLAGAVKHLIRSEEA